MVHYMCSCVHGKFLQRILQNSASVADKDAPQTSSFMMLHTLSLTVYAVTSDPEHAIFTQ